MLLTLLLFACPGREVYVPPEPVPDTDTDTSGVEPGEIDVENITFSEYTVGRSNVWNGLVSDGTRLYGRRTDTNVVQISTDSGRTWTAGAEVEGYLFGGATGIYALGTQHLSRVTNNGTAAEVVTLPTGLTAVDVNTVASDDAGTLWIATKGTPKALWRLPVGGAWTAVEVGAPENLWLCGSGGPFAVLRDFQDVFRWDGSALVAVGTTTEPSECFVSDAGTVFIEEGYGPFTEVRIPVEGTATRSEAFAAFASYLRHDGALFRRQQGLLETSTDDGATWTSSITWPTEMHVYNLVSAGTDVVAMTFGNTYNYPYDQAVLRLPENGTAWEYTTVMGAVFYQDIRDFAFTLDGRLRLLARDNIQYRVYLQDAYGAWRKGPAFDDYAALAMGAEPEGEQVVVGGGYGQYALIEDYGAEVTPLRVESFFGTVEENAITSFAWIPASWGKLLIATTADEGDTEGRVWTTPNDDEFWTEITPQGVRLGGYYAVGVRATEPTATLVTMRSWYTTNGWIPYLMSATAPPRDDSTWSSEDPFWGYAPLSTTLSPISPIQAILYPEGAGLMVRAHGYAAWAKIPSVDREAAVARFDPQGRLWYAVGRNLWVSDAPIQVAE